MTQGSEQGDGSGSLENKPESKKEACSTDQVDLSNSGEALQAELDGPSETLSSLSERLAQAERTNAKLTDELGDKERIIASLSTQLAHSEREIEKTTGSLGWRLLNSYGRVKYRYLLPVYRLLALLRNGRQRKKSIQDSSINGSMGLASSTQPESAAPGARAVITSIPDKTKLPDSHSYDIVCFPIIEWDFRFQRPQQLMLRFASAGHRVFYLSQTFHSSSEAFTLVQKSDNVFEVSLCGPPQNTYTEVPGNRVIDNLLRSLDLLRRELDLTRVVSIVQLPFWWRLAEKARSGFGWPIVYDCMDFHAGFATNGRKMIDEEGGLLRSADLVVASSTILESEARKQNSNVTLIQNGCDYEHFSTTRWDKSERSVIGYYGAIEDWFDVDLVADLAERHPEWDFVLVGSSRFAKTKRLSKLPNVSMPGEKHYSIIPDWLGRFDVTILPFKRTPLTEATNPVKAYEILAAGKPLVAVPIPEMASLVPLVRLASSAEEFETQIAAALEETSDELKAQRQAFARLHTWQKRFEQLSPQVDLLLAKAAITE